VELIETLWWHPERAATPEHAWLRRTMMEVATCLPPAATAPRPMPARATAIPAIHRQDR
jgi:hypothetical protein